MGNNNKWTAFIAALWSFIERLSTQAVSFFIGIVLARLLSPHDYGVLGLTAIFIAFSNIFIDSGFANGLIRKKERTEQDLSTAFYFNFAVGVVVYLILVCLSPVIANFFNEPLLKTVIPIVGLNVFFNSLCIVQTAILTASLKIKEQAIYNWISVTIGGIVAIILAYKGFGIYALACQSVLASIIKTILLWIFARWRPKSNFSKESFKYLWGYGSKLLGAKLISGTINEAYSVLIGKFIGISELGYFSKGSSLSSQVNGVTSGIVQRISLPVLSKYQDDKNELVNKYNHILRLLVLIIAPLSSFLCIAGNDIIVFLWTDKWVDTIILFQLLIVSTMFEPIGQLTLSLFEVVGRSDLILKLEFPKKTTYLVYIAIGFIFGVKGLCIAKIFISATEGVFNIFWTKKILPISRRKQLWSAVRYMFLAFPVPLIASYFINFESLVLNMILKFIVLAITYVILLLITRDSIFQMYVTTLFRKIQYKK